MSIQNSAQNPPTPRPYPYKHAHVPYLHTGVLAVTGSREVDLGLRHPNFDVLAAPVGAGAAGASDYFTVNAVPATSRAEYGKFTIYVKDPGGQNIDGGLAGTPTTASTQATGATGALAWRINVDKMVGTLDGVAFELAAQADFVVYSGAGPITAAPAQSIVYALVLLQAANGTFSTVVVAGTAAATGSQVAPTDAVIAADVTVAAGLRWVRLADLTINRTADTTVTQSQNNKVRHNNRLASTPVNVQFIAVERDSQIPLATSFIR